MVAQVAGVQLVPVIGENPPISKTSLTTEINMFIQIKNLQLNIIRSVLSTHLGGKGVGEFCHWGEPKMRGLSVEPAKTRQQGSVIVNMRLFEETPPSEMNVAQGFQTFQRSEIHRNPIHFNS